MMFKIKNKILIKIKKTNNGFKRGRGRASMYFTQKPVQKNFFSRKAVGGSMTLRLQFIN